MNNFFMFSSMLDLFEDDQGSKWERLRDLMWWIWKKKKCSKLQCSWDLWNAMKLLKSILLDGWMSGDEYGGRESSLTGVLKRIITPVRKIL